MRCNHWFRTYGSTIVRRRLFYVVESSLCLCVCVWKDVSKVIAQEHLIDGGGTGGIATIFEPISLLWLNVNRRILLICLHCKAQTSVGLAIQCKHHLALRYFLLPLDLVSNLKYGLKLVLLLRFVWLQS